ncbi:hypothetical protein CSC70_08755 [Pseudoxanthomonas kalamensis DSM 18571]|uniref:low temperature requirement protein A n=1 Tax=Pseudoxanthomonas kalamensis TaxID=289483 RepID=UPI00139120FD|nr:low temperature requirement protein A [Pseudoxanthomonas kalamensis]KAF1709778.1 hypothetical protein CSC70_08755 [Pseudoxanthomonas kalamensis DSM 18571]
MSSAPHPLLRVRDGHEAKVSYAELLFDLVYVFAVTQVSHFLLGHLSWAGIGQAMLLWFAVWLGWQYTVWVTNWFDPETRPIRLLLFGIMLLALLMAAALPEAFGERGLLFAGSYAAIQVGRALFIRLSLRGQPLAANYTRILGWACISAAFWLAGGFSEGGWRIGLWSVAVLCEYVSPMLGFPLPGLGRSDSKRDWTIEGGHLVERCGLFMIVALGESILVTGATLAHEHHWDSAIVGAFLISFVGSLAMWWIYFNVAVKDATRVIVAAEDPGRYGAYYHYVHVIILAGVIVAAVANDLVIAHPRGHLEPIQAGVLLGGAALFLLGNGLYKRAVYGRFPLSHLAGFAGLLALLPVALHAQPLLAHALVLVVLLAVAIWETRSRPRTAIADAHSPVA